MYIKSIIIMLSGLSVVAFADSPASENESSMKLTERADETTVNPFSAQVLMGKSWIDWNDSIKISAPQLELSGSFQPPKTQLLLGLYGRLTDIDEDDLEARNPGVSFDSSAYEMGPQIALQFKNASAITPYFKIQKPLLSEVKIEASGTRSIGELAYDVDYELSGYSMNVGMKYQIESLNLIFQLTKSNMKLVSKSSEFSLNGEKLDLVANDINADNESIMLGIEI